MLYKIITNEKKTNNNWLIKQFKINKKIYATIAFEYRERKSGKSYAKIIKDYSTKSLKPIFNNYIKNSMQILTNNGLNEYNPIKKEHLDLKQILSNIGNILKILHLQIRNFKNWLRGTSFYSNKKHLQKYIDKYFFILNKRNYKASILDKTIEIYLKY